jgi:hypothetical protein
MTKHYRAYETLDRVRDLFIKWRADQSLDQDLVTELDEALTNLWSDGDAWDWLTGKNSSAFYFNADTTDSVKVIERIRELHKPVKSYKGKDHTEIVGCYECEETGSGREYYVEYPCPTIKALDGDD